MKRTIIPVFILTVLFAACNLHLLEKDDKNLSDVVYSADWRFISIYLDGKSAPISVNYNKDASDGANASVNARAMTPDTARRGFDYFEVFFYYKGTVARSAWEVGRRASIMDVYRTDSGIDYSATNLISIAGGASGNNAAGGANRPVSGIGSPGDSPVGVPGASAILFAGRKNDKTLLAVGKLISVDKEEPTSNLKDRSTLIKSGTTYVTFELSAFTANTSADITKSSFLTDNTGSGAPGPEKAKTNVVNVFIGDKDFPLYILPPGKKNISAQYNFGIDGDWSDFENSILVIDKGTVDKRQARYPAGSGHYWYPVYGEDLTTFVDMTNNQPAGNLEFLKGKPLFFQNPVTFVIDASDTKNTRQPDNGIFTFAFSIPVCALSMEIPRSEDDCWYIRPAYTSYYYNIDNGVTDGKYSDKNIGGAVLCAVDLQAVNYKIPADRR